jgi:hypothetical protein
MGWRSGHIGHINGNHNIIVGRGIQTHEWLNNNIKHKLNKLLTISGSNREPRISLFIDYKIV